MFATQSSMTPARVAATGVALGMLLWSLPVYAYLDPATGSIILQGLLAGFAGLTVVVRLYWRRIRAFFRSLRGAAPLPDEADQTATPESK